MSRILCSTIIYAMGATFSSLFCRLFEKKQFRIGMCGLDNAGKTTILYKLKFGEVVKLIPTIGFNNETIEYRNVSFHIWDVGGNDRGRRWWSRQIFSDMKALICVIDSNDRERVDQVPMELGEILEANEFSDSVVLVLANKQDLPNAMSTDELAEQLGKVSQLRNRKWHIQSTCGITGEGLYEGLDWLVNEVSKLP